MCFKDEVSHSYITVIYILQNTMLGWGEGNGRWGKKIKIKILGEK